MTGILALPRMLYGAAAGLGLAGAVLWIIPAGTGAPTAPADATDGGPVQAPAPPGADTARAGVILEGNVLSAARRPPRTRLRPAGEPGTATTPQSRPATFQPRLFGTVVGPEEASALIDADPSVPGAELYRPGDRLLGRRLTEVTDSNVVLDGPAGRLVLRLERMRDPSR